MFLFLIINYLMTMMSVYFMHLEILLVSIQCILFVNADSPYNEYCLFSGGEHFYMMIIIFLLSHRELSETFGVHASAFKRKAKNDKPATPDLNAHSLPDSSQVQLLVSD